MSATATPDTRPQLPIYVVYADRTTGEWYGEPVRTYLTQRLSDFLDLGSTNDFHRDVWDTPAGMRLIVVQWRD